MATEISSSDSEELTKQKHSTRFAGFVEAALAGDLEKFKKAAKILDCNGFGIEKVLSKIKGSCGLSASHFAAIGGHTHICKYFIKELKLDVNIKDSKGQTPLHHAVLMGNYSAAAYLLANGANPNAVSIQGQTALHHAADSGVKKLLLLLISKGAEVDAIADSGTPLQEAAYNGKCKLTLAYVGMIIQQHFHGFFIANGNKEAMKVLLDNHANLNMILQHLHSPLCLSIIAQSFDCVKLLVQAGADSNLISCGVSPLRVAALTGKSEIIKYLLDVKADPNVHNGDLTPLEASALRKNYKAVKILFPVTSPIKCIPEWSLEGIIRHLASDTVGQERMLKEDEFWVFHKMGSDAFQRFSYEEAVDVYKKALSIKPDEYLYCIRSLCWCYMNNGKAALSDAKACIKQSPDMSLGYCREGLAYNSLRDLLKSADSFARALKLEPDKKHYQSLYWEAIELESEILLGLHDLFSKDSEEPGLCF